MRSRGTSSSFSSTKDAWRRRSCESLDIGRSGLSGRGTFQCGSGLVRSRLAAEVDDGVVATPAIGGFVFGVIAAAVVDAVDAGAVDARIRIGVQITQALSAGEGIKWNRPQICRDKI